MLGETLSGSGLQQLQFFLVLLLCQKEISIFDLYVFVFWKSWHYETTSEGELFPHPKATFEESELNETRCSDRIFVYNQVWISAKAKTVNEKKNLY